MSNSDHESGATSAPSLPVSETDYARLLAIGQQLGTAMENARLLEDLARERAVARTLLETAQALSTTLQLDKLLERVLDELQRVMPYDAASISLLHDERCWIAASRGREPASPTGFALPDCPLVQRVVHERGPVIASGIDGVGAQGPSPAETGTGDLAGGPRGGQLNWPLVKGLGPAYSWLGLPLISKDRVIGVLTIESCQEGVYDDRKAHLALAFAQQASLAIDNARLYEQTRAYLHETLLLHNITAAMSSTLDMGQLLPYVARSLCEALNSTSAEIYKPGKAGDDAGCNTITVIAQAVASEATAGAGRSRVGQTYPLASFPAAAQVLAHSRPMQIRADDPEMDPRERANLETHGAQAALLLPMVVHDHTVGLATVWESGGPRHFTHGEIATGQTLTHQAAIAMEHARLFEETQRRVGELQLLHNVGLAAASGLHLEDTLQAAAEALATALDNTRVAIMVLDPESNTLGIAASTGYPPDMVHNLRLHPGEGISGWVAKYGRAALVPDVRLDSRYVELAPDVRSELCVPLIAGPQLIGVLNVESPAPSAFTADDLRLLGTLASNLGLFIERARLFEEVEIARVELEERAKALEEANIRLQELDRLKDRFLANVSHELRTPLNSVIGLSEVLIDGMVGQMEPRQFKCVEDILSSAQHLLALINDILDISKIEAGHMALEPTTFEVADLLAEVYTAIAPLIEKKSQKLTVREAPGLPPLTADRFRVKQVLLNLLGNANKFTPVEGRITLSCRLADPATLRFSVADTGIGIRPEDQRIIFEEFQQAGDTIPNGKGCEGCTHPSHPHDPQGTGLGLAISKRLIEMHGGRIWVESEYTCGAIFSFSLPLNGPPAANGE